MKLIDADALPRTTQIYEFNGKRMEKEIVDAKFIDTAPAIDAAPRWIPCEERLPELDEICLVTEKDGSIRHCYFDSVDPVLFATVEEGMYVRNVTAWMPLPEPYVGERKDDE